SAVGDDALELERFLEADLPDRAGVAELLVEGLADRGGGPPEPRHMAGATAGGLGVPVGALPLRAPQHCGEDAPPVLGGLDDGSDGAVVESDHEWSPSGRSGRRGRYRGRRGGEVVALNGGSRATGS